MSWIGWILYFLTYALIGFLLQFIYVLVCKPDERAGFAGPPPSGDDRSAVACLPGGSGRRWSNLRPHSSSRSSDQAGD